MKKIKSEFLTEIQANTAMEKINVYCKNAKIIYDNNFNYDYNNYIPDDNFFDFPDTSSLHFASFGVTANVRENKYNRVFSHSGYNQSSRVTLEADVADDNFEYVKDKLYSLGAVIVI